MKRGFRGQAIYLVQSPPFLEDLGGTSQLKRSELTSCVYTVAPAGEELGVRVNPSLFT
jgi:hypothetical protein